MNSDVVKTYIGMLMSGQTDFEWVNELLEDEEYSEEALGLSGRLPREATLRQRMDQIGDRLRLPILRTNIDMFTGSGVRPSANALGMCPWMWT